MTMSSILFEILQWDIIIFEANTTPKVLKINRLILLTMDSSSLVYTHYKCKDCRIKFMLIFGHVLIFQLSKSSVQFQCASLTTPRISNSKTSEKHVLSAKSKFFPFIEHTHPFDVFFSFFSLYLPLPHSLSFSLPLNHFRFLPLLSQKIHVCFGISDFI